MPYIWIYSSVRCFLYRERKYFCTVEKKYILKFNLTHSFQFACEIAQDFIKITENEIQRYLCESSAIDPVCQKTAIMANKFDFDVDAQVSVSGTLFISVYCEIWHACKMWLCSIFREHVFMTWMNRAKSAANEIGVYFVCVCWILEPSHWKC